MASLLSQGRPRGLAPVCAVFLLALILVLSDHTANAAKQVVNCDVCTRNGSPYVCKTEFASFICTQRGSDAVCNTDTGCVCCHDEQLEGCSLCDISTDEYEDDEELFEGVPWPPSLSEVSESG